MEHRHVLVVGGTGMLRGVCLNLAVQGRTVSVVARTHQALQKIVDETASFQGLVNPVLADYTDADVFGQQLSTAANTYGPYEMVISWIHETAPKAHLQVAQVIETLQTSCFFYDILGSAYASPLALYADRGREFKGFHDILYHSIILGFLVEKGSSRWLTHEEICSGVLAAITSAKTRSIIGVVDPWSQRP